MDIEADYNSNDLMANNPASSNINNFNFSFSNNFIQNNSKLTKINNLNNINFLSFNVRGLNDLSKSLFLKDFLEIKDVTVCFLQETHLDSLARIEELEELFSNFFCYFTLNKIKTRGVGILIRKSLKGIKISNKIFDIESRYINLEIETSDYKFNFLNIYAPNLENEQFDFISNIYNICASNKLIFLAGDFNAVNNIKDRIGSSQKKLKSYENEWIKFFRNFYLKEIKYENQISLENKMTWGNNGCFSRIDRIYVSDLFYESVRYIEIIETTKSDHKAVLAKINFLKLCKNENKIYNPWKLNDTILEEQDVIKGLKIKFF